MSSGIVYYTNHFINNTITQFFAKANNLKLENICNYNNNSNQTFISYGILRGTGEVLSKSNNYIYIDHGYMSASDRSFSEDKKTYIKNLNGYFRVIKNDLYFNHSYNNSDKTRFDRLGINLKELNKKGEKIIISEPSEYIQKFLKLQNWTSNTISELKKYTDREIVIHNKFSEIPLNSVLKDAFAFISCQSTAAYHALSEGVPVFFTHESLKRFGEIKNIEKRILNHSLLYIAANSQWKLAEFFSDDFKNFLNKI